MLQAIYSEPSAHGATIAGDKLMMSSVLPVVFAVFSGLAETDGPTPELWRYPCDVFIQRACFRLPVGMNVKYEVPADFAVYRISESDTEIMTIYIGYNPGRIEGHKPSVLLSTDSYYMEWYAEVTNGLSILNIYLRPKDQSLMTVHFAGDFSRESSKALANVLSGLRPCKGSVAKSFSCSVDERWQSAFSTLLSVQDSDSQERQ